MVTAIVLGGASLGGGRGTIMGTVVGLLIIGVLNNGLILLNVDHFWQEVARGTLLIAAVSFDQLRHRAWPQGLTGGVSMAKLRLGVIGAGSWAVAAHLPNLATPADEVEFVGVCRQGASCLARIKERSGSRSPVEDYRDVIDAGVDIVVVASPTGLHHEHATAALEAGAHVMCEKPLTIDPAAGMGRGRAGRAPRARADPLLRLELPADDAAPEAADGRHRHRDGRAPCPSPCPSRPASC